MPKPKSEADWQAEVDRWIHQSEDWRLRYVVLSCQHEATLTKLAKANELVRRMRNTRRAHQRKLREMEADMARLVSSSNPGVESSHD